MKFLKLSESGPLQNLMKTKSNQLLTQAENIKKARSWEPSSAKLTLDIEPLQPSRHSYTPQASALKESPPVVSSEEDYTHVVRPTIPAKHHPKPPVSGKQLSPHETYILFHGGKLNGSQSEVWVNEPSIKEFSRDHERSFM